jgi:hypothetical protein
MSDEPTDVSVITFDGFNRWATRAVVANVDMLDEVSDRDNVDRAHFRSPSQRLMSPGANASRTCSACASSA